MAPVGNLFHALTLLKKDKSQHLLQAISASGRIIPPMPWLTILIQTITGGRQLMVHILEDIVTEQQTGWPLALLVRSFLWYVVSRTIFQE